ncbi:MAG: NADH pyrophosphatase, partial [Alphaproteobacteria bacterium]|nr:NADH pyrophosphatase [Alphaproteobacteria bacterium]
MSLDVFLNTFAGNPLDRASDRRSDAEWIARQLASPDGLAIPMWNGRPFVESGKQGGVQIAYVPTKMAKELSEGTEQLLFLGLWKETAVFAVDLEGESNPADGPLQGMGAFEDLRLIALKLPPTESAIVATAKAMFEW